jgi:cell wall-associated NlpC family hydrolase
MPRLTFLILASFICSCNWEGPKGTEGLSDTLVTVDTFNARTSVDSVVKDSTVALKTDNTVNRDTTFIPPAKTVDVGNVQPQQIIDYAKTLIGVRYVWGSTNPNVGFDCSGFITHVFNHFKISVPRSSIDFTYVGKHVTVEEAKPGDLILFTGTNPKETFVGHMGIVLDNNNGALNFIHSTSGKAMGVTITPLSDYYKTRYVKTVRIFP